MPSSSDRQAFSNAIYGNSGNSGNTFGGGGPIMGSPAQIAQRMGFGRKKGRNQSRGKSRAKRR